MSIQRYIRQWLFKKCGVGARQKSPHEELLSAIESVREAVADLASTVRGLDRAVTAQNDKIGDLASGAASSVLGGPGPAGYDQIEEIRKGVQSVKGLLLSK